jgi:hypothetical protein
LISVNIKVGLQEDEEQKVILIIDQKFNQKIRSSMQSEVRMLINDYALAAGTISVVGKMTLWTCVYIEVTFSVWS